MALAEPNPSAVVTPTPKTAVETPWPVGLPCAPLRLLEVEGQATTISWASSDGGKVVTFGREIADGAVALPSGIASGRLTRLWSAEGPPPDALSLDCRPPASDGDGRHAVEWQLFPGGRSEVAVTYPLAQVPHPRRWTRWIVRAPHKSGDPELATPSPFERKIAGRGRDAAELERASVQLTRDLVSDLEEMLKIACAGRRCSGSVRAFDPIIQKILKSTMPAYERLDHDVVPPQPFGVNYEWRISSEQAQAHVACHDVGDGTSFQVLGEVTLSDANGVQLRYDAFHGQLELSEPSGLISFDELEHGGRLTISGGAVALRTAR